MAFSEAYNGTNATWGTEYSLTGSGTTIQTQTTDGVYAPYIDCNALARGDVYRLRAYEKVQSTGTQRLVFRFDIRNAQSDPIITIPPLMLMHGWDFTLQRIAGTDRTITWSVKGITGNVTEVTSGNPTVGTTEYYLASASTTKTKQTTDGAFQTFVDLNALAKSDLFQFRAYELARSADTTDRALMTEVLAGVRTHKIQCSPALILMHGWEFSLKKLSGTDQAIPYSIRKAA